MRMERRCERAEKVQIKGSILSDDMNIRLMSDRGFLQAGTAARLIGCVYDKRGKTRSLSQLTGRLANQEDRLVKITSIWLYMLRVVRSYLQVSEKAFQKQ